MSREDERSGLGRDILAARVRSSGQVVDPEGIPVTTAEEDQASPTVSWGAGTYLVAFARGRWWQAEHCIGAVRDRTLALACIRRNLESTHGRGYDDLPPTVLDPPGGRSLVTSLAPEAVLEALKAAVDGLLREPVGLGELTTKAAQTCASG